MPNETLAQLNPQPGGRYVDCTVGAGGHAAAILAAEPTCQLLGLDRDTNALAVASERLAPFGDRVRLVHTNYHNMITVLDEIEWDGVDGILLDVGLSSMQIDEASRGFSFQVDGPLDMRMDRRERITASTLLNNSELGELVRIFRQYGEEPRARQIATAIVRRRETQPWESTEELANLIRKVLHHYGDRRCPAVPRIFQALRIAVNGELESLQNTLDDAIHALKPAARLVVLTFHSLEDRIVKETFREAARDCVCPPVMPICTCDKVPTLKVLTRKPLRAHSQELRENSRAKCAKLRSAERLPWQDEE